MQFSTLSLSISLVALAAASPLLPENAIEDKHSAGPSGLNALRRDGELKVPQAITETQMAALSELEARDITRREGELHLPKPITDSQFAALSALEARNSLQGRDQRLNCAKNVLGDTTIGGHKVGWVPVDQYLEQAEKFCQSYQTTDVALSHEISETYPVKLTNQDDPTAPGDDGNVVFAVFNTQKSPSYLNVRDTCYDSMKKQSNTDSLCYGSKNKDTEGGYWHVTDVGYFGSEVRKA